MDVLDFYYYSVTTGFDDGALSDNARRKAISLVLPQIMERDLTPQQNLCLRYKYVNNMSQAEIAKKLKISQPTVSRRINTAKDTVNEKLSYCFLAVQKAIAELQ